MVLAANEAAARAAGFSRAELMATLAGEPLYLACGYAPIERVDKMAAEMNKALTSPELREAWTNLGSDTPNLYGDDFGKFVSSEVKRWAEVAKASGAKLD